MRLGDLGEFGLIARIQRAAAKLPRSRAVVLAIGDDAAVLRPRSGEDLVVTTDSLVENVHFRWRTQSARIVGRRALVANLSDLAAMGARPLGFTMALVAPPELAVRSLDGLVALTSADEVNIVNNDALADVDGLAAYTSGGPIIISGNDQLASLAGLASLWNSTVLLIIDNDSLPSLQGLENYSSSDAIVVSGNNTTAIG